MNGMKLLGSEGLMIGQELLAVHRQLLFLTALMPGNVACSTKQKVKVGILMLKDIVRTHQRALFTCTCLAQAMTRSLHKPIAAHPSSSTRPILIPSLPAVNCLPTFQRHQFYASSDTTQQPVSVVTLSTCCPLALNTVARL